MNDPFKHCYTTHQEVFLYFAERSFNPEKRQIFINMAFGAKYLKPVSAFVWFGVHLINGTTN